VKQRGRTFPAKLLQLKIAGNKIEVADRMCLFPDYKSTQPAFTAGVFNAIAAAVIK
jgi:hypothetical protein